MAMGPLGPELTLVWRADSKQLFWVALEFLDFFLPLSLHLYTSTPLHTIYVCTYRYTHIYLIHIYMYTCLHMICAHYVHSMCSILTLNSQSQIDYCSWLVVSIYILFPAMRWWSVHNSPLVARHGNWISAIYRWFAYWTSLFSTTRQGY